ncbi:hypothetical protein ACIBCS_43315 [Streptomyces phaeochromogenes]|uniref:hypothetical protein n=1 Tax=Streptomyces phaeochromogenes TaxID=1923 RepID=UPI0033CE0791
MPETLVVDRATTAVTPAVLAVCASLGISLETAPPRAGDARRGAARTLGTLAAQFTRHIAAVRPPAAAEEGTEGGAYWSLSQLQDLLDEWILAMWHHRPQEQLQHPLLGRASLTPQECGKCCWARPG